MNQNQEIWSVKKLLQWSAEYLVRFGIETPQLDVQLMLAKVLEVYRIRLLMNFEKPLHRSELDVFKVMLKRRALHEPVAYILGKKSFYKNEFDVGPGVLIPRPETELIVEKVIELAMGKSPVSILDIGTGSGCIALSLALAMPECQVTAWDISETALEMAHRNAKKLGAGNCRLQQVDACSAEVWLRAEKYDFIVSNPPYIADSEHDQLPKSVIDHEPKSALFADHEGLLFYKVFAAHARQLLNDSGLLLAELGHRQANAVRDIFQRQGWTDVKIAADYSGIERLLVARK